jgi:hypothetical protein
MQCHLDQCINLSGRGPAGREIHREAQRRIERHRSDPSRRLGSPLADELRNRLAARNGQRPAPPSSWRQRTSVTTRLSSRSLPRSARPAISRRTCPTKTPLASSTTTSDTNSSRSQPTPSDGARTVRSTGSANASKAPSSTPEPQRARSAAAKAQRGRSLAADTVAPIIRSHQGRTAMSNPAKSGYGRHAKGRIARREPAWAGRLPTFMVRGSTVRVRQRASGGLQGFRFPATLLPW